MQKITFLLLIGLIAWSSCTQQGDIRAYYFPMKDLTEGLVYEYRPVEDDSLPVSVLVLPLLCVPRQCIPDRHQIR
jgi:hypothetical protein